MGTWLRRSSSRKKYVLKHEPESMDIVLDHLLLSDGRENCKKEFVTCLCDKVEDANLDENCIRKLLLASIKHILRCHTPLDVHLACQVFQVFGFNQPQVFHAIFTPDYISQILQGSSVNVPLLIKEGFCVMDGIGTLSQSEHVMVVQHSILRYLEKATELVAVRQVADLLSQFMSCVPDDETDQTRLVEMFVTHLSGSREEISFETLFEHSEVIADLLGRVWTYSISHSEMLLNRCLGKIFIAISRNTEEDCGSPICLAAVVGRVPLSMANRVVKEVVTDPDVTPEALTSAIGQVIEWLRWPAPSNVDKWLLCFLSELVAAQKFKALIRVIEVNAEQIMENLKGVPCQRRPSFVVLQRMLLGYQHSPQPFHDCLGKVPAVLDVLSRETGPESRVLLADLAQLIHCLMFQYTGFPELYDPILTMLEEFERPSNEEITKKLHELNWMSPANFSTVLQSSGPVVHFSDLSIPKLEMGKTGLENLGNTCFANSVLQALYMCDQFYREVLSRSPTFRESLLIKLQQLFVHLALSTRPTFAPRSFIEVSRPSTYLPGQQQDCSEFLRYLLTRLDEDERASAASLVPAPPSIQKSPSTSSLSSTGGAVIVNSGSPSKADKKAQVTLTSVRMRTEEEMNGVGSSPPVVNSPRSDQPPPSDSMFTLVDRTFGGQANITIRCLQCNHSSTIVDRFRQINLSFPDSTKESVLDGSPQQLAGGNGLAFQRAMDCTPPFPADSHRSSQASFSLNDLFTHYLKPEKLSGENQYECSKCGQRQDGVKTVQFVRPPNYLNITLMRFAISNLRHFKTNQDIRYPRTLSLPVYEKSDASGDLQRQTAQNGGYTEADIRHQAVWQSVSERLAPPDVPPAQSYQLYGLTAVIVHSGMSPDSGHYYCYARHSKAGQVNTQLLENLPQDLSNLDLLPDKWYNFNDSHVSTADFDAFSNISKKFDKDTAYVLIYRKLSIKSSNRMQSEDPIVRSDLRELVMKDNEAHFREQEQGFKRRGQRTFGGKSSFMTFRSNQDEDDDSNHGGHPGCSNGMGGMNQGPPLVY